MLKYLKFINRFLFYTKLFSKIVTKQDLRFIYKEIWQTYKDIKCKCNRFKKKHYYIAKSKGNLFSQCDIR